MALILDRLLKRRGTGWRQNPTDRRDYDIDRLGIPSAELPEAASMWNLVAAIRDQGPTNSCVGQALAAAVTIREVATNKGWRPASALFPYWYSRYALGEPVRDEGTFIRPTAQTMARIGIPDEVHWPMVPGRVNRQPGPEALMQAYPRAGGLYATIQDFGTARISAVRACLAAGYPVVMGLRIDDAFLLDTGPEVIEEPKVTRYGHAGTAIGYKPAIDGSYLFEVLNSWGPGWRKGGRAWITEGYLRATTKAADLTVVHGWKRIQ